VRLLEAKLPNGQFVIPSVPNARPIPAAGGPMAPVPVPVAAISRFREDQFNTNLEFQASSANRVATKFFWANNPETQGLFNSFGTGNALPVPGFGSSGTFNQRLLAIDDTHILGPALLNELRFGYSRISTLSVPQEPLSSAQLGIATPLGNAYPGMPEISVTNMFDLGASPFSDNHAAEENCTAGETLAWGKGSHSITLGAEYKCHNVAATFNLFVRGEMIFPGLSGDPFRTSWAVSSISPG
jgi:hypothetical protein